MANPVVETDQPTVDLGAKIDAPPTASQRGACAGHVEPNTDCTTFSSSPHTVSAYRRAAFDGVQSPHASHRRTADLGVETDQPTVDLGRKSTRPPPPRSEAHARATSSLIRTVQPSPPLHTPFRPTDGRRLMVYSHLTHRIDARQTWAWRRTNLQSI